MSKEYDLGKEGEEIAVKHLSKSGYKILSRNWRFKQLEIDIVAIKDNLLVIAEVKTRSDNYFLNPEDSVTLKKQRFLFEAAEAYLESYDLDYELRFDIISVIHNNNKYNIDHIENAFRPGW